MDQAKQGINVFLPAPLMRIAAAAIPIVAVCYFVSGLHDKPLAPEDASADVVAARLQPVAQIGTPDRRAQTSSLKIPARMLDFPGNGSSSILNQAVAFVSE